MRVTEFPEVHNEIEKMLLGNQNGSGLKGNTGHILQI